MFFAKLIFKIKWIPNFLGRFVTKIFTIFNRKDSWMRPIVLVFCSEVVSVELLCLLFVLLLTHVVTYLHSMFFPHFFISLTLQQSYSVIYLALQWAARLIWVRDRWSCAGAISLVWVGDVSHAQLQFFMSLHRKEGMNFWHTRTWGPLAACQTIILLKLCEMSAEKLTLKYHYTSLKLLSTCGNSFFLCIFREG